MILEAEFSIVFKKIEKSCLEDSSFLVFAKNTNSNLSCKDH